MDNSISYDIKNATEKFLNAEPILIHDKDVTLNLNFDSKVKWICHNCNNEAGIVRVPGSGHHCGSCAIDTRLHGIAEEEIKDGLS